jgi:hypothetical protein
MSVPTRPQRYNQRSAGDRWETIRYAIDDTARTVRLCAIILVTSSLPCVLVLLIHR